MQRRHHLLSAFLFLLLLTVSCSETGTSPNEPIVSPPNSSENSAPEVSIADVSGLTLAGGSVAASLSATVTDAENDAFTYQWSVTSGNASEVSFASSTDEDTDVTFRAAGDYTLQLAVTDVDDTSSTGSATVSVTVNEADGSDPSTNESPEADAGEDQEVGVGEEVVLDGSGSSDPDGDTLSYAWELTSQPEGSDASLSGANTATPTFTPSAAGDYTAQLTVIDGNGGSDTDSVTISTEAEDQPPGDPDPPVNTAPQISIEDVTDLTLEDGSVTANLDATVTDTEGDTFTYQWSVTSGEAGNVDFDAPTSEDTDVTFSAVGNYILQLTVVDTEDASSTASATLGVTVQEGSAVVTPPEDEVTLVAADIDATEEGEYVITYGPATIIDTAYIFEASTYPAGAELEVTVTGTPAQGAASENGGEILYEASEGFSGVDSFEYTLTDETTGAFDTGTITVSTQQ